MRCLHGCASRMYRRCSTKWIVICGVSAGLASRCVVFVRAMMSVRICPFVRLRVTYPLNSTRHCIYSRSLDFFRVICSFLPLRVRRPFALPPFVRRRVKPPGPLYKDVLYVHYYVIQAFLIETPSVPYIRTFCVSVTQSKASLYFGTEWLSCYCSISVRSSPRNASVLARLSRSTFRVTWPFQKCVGSFVRSFVRWFSGPIEARPAVLPLRAVPDEG